MVVLKSSEVVGDGVADCRRELQEAGWQAADFQIADSWIVAAFRGPLAFGGPAELLEATAASRVAAWRLACRHAADGDFTTIPAGGRSAPPPR